MPLLSKGHLVSLGLQPAGCDKSGPSRLTAPGPPPVPVSRTVHLATICSGWFQERGGAAPLRTDLPARHTSQPGTQVSQGPPSEGGTLLTGVLGKELALPTAWKSVRQREPRHSPPPLP